MPALAVAVLSLVFAATAAAEVRSGSATDGTEPERIAGSIDIVAVGASYDTAGSLSVAVTTAAAPPVTEEKAIAARFGMLSGEECVAPVAAMLGSYERPPIAQWAASDGSGEATESFAGSTTTLGASAPALAEQPFNCVEPAIYEVIEGPEGPELGEVVEGLTAPIQLVGPPPPVSPPSSPPPSPPPHPAPASPPKADLSVPAKTITLHRNVWKKVTVKITNTGTAAAAKVALAIGKARGVAIKPKSAKLKLGTIAAGESKTVAFAAKLTAKAKPSSKLTLALRGAKGVKASGVVTLEAWKKPRPKKKGKEAPPANPPLAEKIFYSYRTEVSEAAKLIGYAFLDGGWAYHGFPAEGLPSCTAVTGDGAKEGAEGCVRYSYDPTSGSVKIGSVTGRLDPGGELEIDGETYSPTSIPAAGTRLQLEQEYVGYRGLCGTFAGCTTWHEHLILYTAGEFVLSRDALSTAGGGGPGETFVAAGSYPADQHGTYAIEKGARIKLSFADGSTKTKTFAYLLNKEGKPDPTNEGVLLGTEYFTFAHDR